MQRRATAGQAICGPPAVSGQAAAASRAAALRLPRQTPQARLEIEADYAEACLRRSSYRLTKAELGVQDTAAAVVHRCSAEVGDWRRAHSAAAPPDGVRNPASAKEHAVWFVVQARAGRCRVQEDCGVTDEAQDTPAATARRGWTPDFIVDGPAPAEGPEEDIAVMAAVQYVRGGGLPILWGSWEERLDQSFELLDRIHERMAEVAIDDDLGWLASRLRDHTGDAPLLARLTQRRFVEGETDWGEVFADPQAVLDLLPAPAQLGFWIRALDETAFGGVVATAPIVVVSRMLDHARAADGDRDLGPWVETALLHRPPTLIEQAIESGEEPFPLMEAEVRRRPLRSRLAVLVADALESTLPRMLEGTREGRARWFALEAGVNTATRSGLRRQLVRRLVQASLTSAQLLDLLTYAGDSITRSRFLSGRPDEAVPRIILPLVNDEPGRQWLIGNAALLQSWISGASPPVAQRVLRQLRLRRQQGLQSAQRLLELLRPPAT